MRIIRSIILVILISASASYSQIENLRSHKQMNLDCKKCHICDTPTKANPCLILCPRNKIEVTRHSPMEGPENIIINEVEVEFDLYGPSNFSHRLHSDMSLMSGGCAICHHFNPPGKIVECSTCHENKRERVDFSVPDLKAAFHRQCMDCHKSWQANMECESCHKLKSDDSGEMTTVKIKKSHPKVTIPIKVLYETESEEGSIITFYHNDHSSLFGFECSSCHSQESCASCHAELKLESLKIDVHDRCSNCHETTNDCKDCHKESVAKPFDHELKAAGFIITDYHAGLDCISCHKSLNKFTGLQKGCNSCHADQSGYFKHSITGINLDETHSELDCADCHKDANYLKKPACNDCHDEDIYFPESIPGERI